MYLVTSMPFNIAVHYIHPFETITPGIDAFEAFLKTVLTAFSIVLLCLVAVQAKGQVQSECITKL